MGRQIQIAATQPDEKTFLSFLRRSGEIAIISTFSRIRDTLWFDKFAPQLSGNWSYHIWNKEFPWKPEYRQTDKANNLVKNGLFYISNLNTAPVIEFRRSDVPKRKYGRIYWAKEFAAPDGLNYDVEIFGKWFDKIVRWVRKNGHKDQSDTFSPYFLPDALKIHRDAQQGHSL